MSTPSSGESTVRLDLAHGRYVIPASGGHTCLGFGNARDHANQIARLMRRAELAFSADDYGSATGYEKYQAAIAAWGTSAYRHRTYFDPGTAPQVRHLLEACRRDGRQVRLVLGNPETGTPWLDEYDVVGRIGRSTGPLKIPLLVPSGEVGGAALLTANMLCIIDWISGKFLYRHAAFAPPDLRLESDAAASLPWHVVHRDTVIARFDDVGKAGAYVAFLRGETIEPRIFQ